ncbi:hypothetical protein J437_LFUL018840 [Ladona fulva]|uniref:MOSC domain-containing protein n=1 Tax=Ladona fulva TaxID=123851 RepID=A0A8K0KPQ4_LADFU|nr:hypothetical protein J437_LFUL018840 [Ladona fulva]
MRIRKQRGGGGGLAVLVVLHAVTRQPALENYRSNGKRRKNRNCKGVIPAEWELFGHLTALKLYPLKSGKGINLEEAEPTFLGLKSGLLRDRFFIVYDERGCFVSGRKYPKMVLITVSAADNGSFKFEAPGHESLIIESPERLSKQHYKDHKFNIRLWSNRVTGLDAGDEAAKWISQLLLSKEDGLRIGCYVPDIAVERKVTPLDKVYKNLTSDDTGAYSDLSAFLLISEDSVAELNERLEDPDKVTYENFRPNLLIKSKDGKKPFMEDDWEWCRIGDKNGPVFRSVKPCTRCIFTTVDPKTGVKNEHMEPLNTLKLYRKLKDPEALRLEGDSPVMGVNLGLYKDGNLKVGDPIYVGIVNKSS